jgi:hypothetical protein
VPAGSRLCYELAPVRERLVTTFGEKPKGQIRMLPHRMAGATWLDSKLERWPALGAALGVDRRKAQRSRADDSKRRGLGLFGQMEASNASHDALREGFPNAGYLLSDPLLERGLSSLSPSPAGLDDPVPIL